MTTLATPPKLQFFDANGNPLAGGKLYTYAAGTTTPLATYTDYGGGTANPNPVILDSRGEANVWLGTALYKFKLTTSTNVDVWTVDNVGGAATLAALAASGGSSLVGFLQAGTGAVATTVQAKLRQTVSVFDFMTAAQIADVQARTLLLDVKAPIQAAINTGHVVYFPAGSYGVSGELTPYASTGRFDLVGEQTRLVTIQALAGFTSGYVLHATSEYVIREMWIKGINSTLGLYGLGTNTAGTSGGETVLDGVSFSFFDECVSFGSEYEHSLALNYDRVYCSRFMRAGINLGGLTGAAASGESNFDFGRITVSNAGQTRTEYSTSVSVNTPTTSYDRLTWTGTVPTYGFVVMRSADGSTGWHVPPNWSSIVGFTALTFDAAKTVAETWFYKVVPNTVGLNVRRAKAISGGSIQTEYVGVGQYYNDIQGGSIATIYYEVRDESIPCPAICGVGVSQALGFEVCSGWVDSASYGMAVASDSHVSYRNVRHAAVDWAGIGMFSSGTDSSVEYSGLLGVTTQKRSVTSSAYDYNEAGREYSTALNEEKLGHLTKAKRSLSYRGTEQSSWAYDATNGTVLSGLNLVDIKPKSKTVMQPTFQAGALTTALTNNVATAFFSFTVPSNVSVALILAVNVDVNNASITRQSAGGLVIINATSASGSVVAGVTNTTVQALQAGTMTGPTFTTSVVGSVVTILCNVNSSQAGTISISVIPISAIGTQQPTALTQA